MRERFNNFTLTRPRFRKVVGWIFVVIGFAALILPIVPGAPLVFIGLEILGLRFLYTDKIKSFFTPKNKPATLYTQPVVNETVN